MPGPFSAPPSAVLITVANDGGGQTRAALRPIMGRDNVAAFIAGKLTHLAQN
jgi:hypothetical protein